MPYLACQSQSFPISGLARRELDELADRTKLELAELDSKANETFEFIKQDDGYRVRFGKINLCASQPFELAAELVRSRIHQMVNAAHPELCYLWGDAVNFSDGRAVLCLGPSLSGQTRLAEALVAAGAQPWCEHFVPLSSDTGVLRYPKIQASQHSVKIAAIVCTTYLPRAAWSPRELSAGETVLKLTEVLSAEDGMQPTTLARLAKLASQAEVRVSGERSDTESVVAYLKERLQIDAGCHS